MAERRMMSKKIIHGDSFLDTPVSAQNLYFHLLLEADDEGFVNSPKRIQRIVNASDDDAKILIDKKFIISFESGVIVIKHWQIHNRIQKDRFIKTSHIDERSRLVTKENKAYSIKNASRLDTKYTHSIEEYSVEKKSIGKDIYSGFSFLNFDTELFEEFLGMREKIKAQNTDRAIKLLLKDLLKLQTKGYDINDIVETSLKNSWKSFYEPKNKSSKSNHPEAGSYDYFMQNKMEVIDVEV